MYLIKPLIITDTNLVSSTVPETDYPVWAVGTTYALGARVILTTGNHSIYRSAVAGNLGNDPATDNGTNWVRESATNRWKAFDGKISDQVSRFADIEYVIEPATTCTAVAAFGLNGALFQVVVEEGATVLYDSTVSLIDNTEVIDAWTYCFSEILYDSEIVIQGVPAFGGTTVTITVLGTGERKIGQLVIGPEAVLGEILQGATIGLTDYSRKERDDFGNPVIIERAFADRAEYPFFTDAADARRVKRLIASVRAIPAVYHAGQEYSRYGLTVFGFPGDLQIPLTTLDAAFINLEVQGLT